MPEAEERGPGTTSNDGEAGSSGRDLATVPLPAIAVSIPTIFDDVLHGNLRCEDIGRDCLLYDCLVPL